MRKPVTATVARPIPTLAALLAGAAASQGCAHIECGESRADELRAHGPGGVQALREGRVRQGIREIAVAAGAVSHTQTQVPEVHRPGEAPAVTVTPPVSPVDEPPITARGRVASVGPSPVQPPPVVRPPVVQPPRQRVTPPHPERPPHPPPMTHTAGAPMRVGPDSE